MKLLKLIVFLAICLGFATTQAQSYKNAIGLRVDQGLNLTYQQYITNGWTAEAIVHTPFRTQEMGLTLLGEKHRKLLFRNANFYGGGGAHYYWKSGSNSDPNEISKNVFGLSGIAGAELSIGKVNISADWKPELHLAGDQVKPLEWKGAAISVRMIIEKRDRKRLFKKKNKKKKKFWVEMWEQ